LLSFADLVTAFLVAQGRAMLRGAVPELAAAERKLKVGLTRDARDRATLRFYPGELYFDRWICSLGRCDLKLVPFTGTLGRGSPKTVYAAFGGYELALAVVRSKKLERWERRVFYPRETLVTLDVLLNFIDANPKRNKMQEFLLWENRNNLRFYKGGDWDGFIASITDDRMEELMRAWHRCLSNVEWKDGEAQAWHEIEKQYENPNKCPRLEFHPGTAAVSAPAGDLRAWRKKLDKALADIEAYARKKGETGFAEYFAACRTEPPPPNFSTTFGPLLKPEAVSLLASAWVADVFQGMGSWNDVPWCDEPEYERVSGRLFKLLQPCIAAAVNR
jgi:hypothetical protein